MQFKENLQFSQISLVVWLKVLEKYKNIKDFFADKGTSWSMKSSTFVSNIVWGPNRDQKGWLLSLFCPVYFVLWWRFDPTGDDRLWFCSLLDLPFHKLWQIITTTTKSIFTPVSLFHTPSKNIFEIVKESFITTLGGGEDWSLGLIQNPASTFSTSCHSWH